MKLIAGFRRWAALASSIMVVTSACSFQGVNSLPLPGTVGRGPNAAIYHIKIANVGTLQENSPVMVGDVIVGTIDHMTVENWRADVKVSVKPDVVVPGNAVATVGQTSLLGSMHISLDPPPGQASRGRLAPGSTLALNRSSTYPSTEQTLSSLAAVVNGGGLGQIGDIIHNFNAALSGHPDQVRDLIARLDNIVGLFDEQRDNIVESIRQLNRLSSTLSDQKGTISAALNRIPRALDVLIKEQPRFTAALDKMRMFSDTATTVVDGAHADLVTTLRNLGPTVAALADVGPDLDSVLAYLPAFPYPQDFIDRGIKGDYVNFFAILDFTIPRLKRALAVGTRWGQPHAPVVPAPGEPWYQNYTYQPLRVGVDPPPAPAGPAPVPAEQPPAAGQQLPVFGPSISGSGLPAPNAPDASEQLAPLDKPEQGGH